MQDVKPHQKRLRLSDEDRILLLRVLGRELDRLEPLVKKEAEANKQGGTYRYTQNALQRETQVLAVALTGETAGRRQRWPWREVTGEWCVKQAVQIDHEMKLVPKPDVE